MFKLANLARKPCYFAKVREIEYISLRTWSVQRAGMSETKQCKKRHLSKLRISWFHNLTALSSLQRIIESSDKSFLLILSILSILWNKAHCAPIPALVETSQSRSDHRLVFASLRAPCDDQISGACSWRNCHMNSPFKIILPRLRYRSWISLIHSFKPASCHRLG